MTWILILFTHAGALSNADSMALTTVSGFKTESNCQAAGRSAEALTKTTTKATRWVCVKQD
jgi:hypothetical protein